MADTDKKTATDRKDDLPPPEYMERAEGDVALARYYLEQDILKSLRDD